MSVPGRDLLDYLGSADRFPELCAFFARKAVSDLTEAGKDDGLRSYITAGFDLLVQRCLQIVRFLAGSPIEEVLLRSVMLAFLRNGLPLLFMSPFRDTVADLAGYRDQLRRLEEFTRWCEQRHGSKVVHETYLEGEVASGRMLAEERPQIEELLLLYHYLPLKSAWHVRLQPRFPQLLGSRGAGRADMLFWLPLRKDRRLVVECDGFQTHGRRASFERDRKRDRALRALGVEVFRFTGRQINGQPAEAAHELFSFLNAWRTRGTHNFSLRRPAPRVARCRRWTWRYAFSRGAMK